MVRLVLHHWQHFSSLPTATIPLLGQGRKKWEGGGGLVFQSTAVNNNNNTHSRVWCSKCKGKNTITRSCTTNRYWRKNVTHFPSLISFLIYLEPFDYYYWLRLLGCGIRLTPDCFHPPTKEVMTAKRNKFLGTDYSHLPSLASPSGDCTNKGRAVRSGHTILHCKNARGKEFDAWLGPSYKVIKMCQQAQVQASGRGVSGGWIDAGENPFDVVGNPCPEHPRFSS